MLSEKRTRQLIRIEAEFRTEGDGSHSIPEKMHFACRDADEAVDYFRKCYGCKSKILVDLRVYTIGKVCILGE